MVKVAEPIWLGLGIALVVLAAFTVAITSRGVHEPHMLYMFALGLGILGIAGIASGAWLARWPKVVAAVVSGVLGSSVVVVLWFYMIYMGSSLDGPR